MCYKYYIYLTDKVAELSLGDVELSLDLIVIVVLLPQSQPALTRQRQTKTNIGLGQALHGSSEDGKALSQNSANYKVRAKYRVLY